MRKLQMWVIGLMACFMAANVANAQEKTYKEVMMRMMKAGNSSTNGMSVDKMKEIYPLVAAEIVKNKHPEWSEEKKNAKVTELVDKYVQERALDDMAEAMLPYFQRNVSQKDLEEYVTVCENPRFQEVNKQITALSESAAMGLMGNVMAIAQGQEPETITAAACPDSYKQAFQTYFDKSGTIGFMDQMTSALSASMPQAGGENAQKFEEMFNKMMTYIKDSYEIVVLNSFVAAGVPEKDLNYMTGVVSMPAYKDLLKSSQEMMGDAMGFGQNIMMNFATWLEGQKF